MKHLIIFILLAPFLFSQTAKTRDELYDEIDAQFANTSNITASRLRGVFKNAVRSADNGLTDGIGITGSGTNAFLTGSSVTFDAGSTLTVSGTFGGTPTAGTLDLSNVTTTLGPTTVGTLNVTAFGTGTLPGANGGTGVDNTGKSLTLGGNFSTSGAYGLTLTLSGTTGVTLPTSGTLATVGGDIGAATATTPAAADDSTKVATTAFVQSEIASVSGGGVSAYQTLTDGATITWTAAAGYPVQNAEVTLAGNRTLAFSGLSDGMRGLLKVTQDSTGSRTLALPSNSYVQGNGAGLVTLTATAGATDFLEWSYDGTNVFWDSPRLNYTTFVPTFSSATIDGTALAVNFTGPVTRGAGYSDAHVDVDMSTTGSNIALTYSSGDGTATLNYTAASAAVNGETVDFDFSGVANSLESSTSGVDVAAIVSGSVTNETVGGFEPSDIASLKIWLKAESLSGTNGDNISTWNDSSGNAYHATAPSGKEPVLVTSSINGLNAIQFTKANADQMLFADAGAKAISQDKAGMTVFIVWTTTATSGLTNSIIFRTTTNASGANRAGLFHSGANSTQVDVRGRRLDAESPTNSSTSGIPGANTYKVHVALFDWANQDAYTWEGATPKITASNLFTTGGNTSNTASTEFTFGGDGGSFGTTSLFAEFLVFDTALSDSDRAAVTGYLNTKFGL